MVIKYLLKTYLMSFKYFGHIGCDVISFEGIMLSPRNEMGLSLESYFELIN